MIFDIPVHTVPSRLAMPFTLQAIGKAARGGSIDVLLLSIDGHDPLSAKELCIGGILDQCRRDDLKVRE